MISGDSCTQDRDRTGTPKNWCLRPVGIFFFIYTLIFNALQINIYLLLANFDAVLHDHLHDYNAVQSSDYKTFVFTNQIFFGP